MKKITKNKRLKARLLLTRQRSDATRRWTLSVEDATSLAAIVEIEFDDATFADLMSASTTGNLGEAKVWNLFDHYGKKHENKTVVVNVPDRDRRSPASLTKLYDQAELENPGWEVDRHEKSWNMHRLRDGGYSVTLRRWVDPEEP